MCAQQACGAKPRCCSLAEAEFAAETWYGQRYGGAGIGLVRWLRSLAHCFEGGGSSCYYITAFSRLDPLTVSFNLYGFARQSMYRYRHAHASSRPKSAKLCHIQVTLFGGLQPVGLAASLPVPINLQPTPVASLRRLPRHLPPPCPLLARLRAPASCLPSSGVEGAPPAIS